MYFHPRAPAGTDAKSTISGSKASKSFLEAPKRPRRTARKVLLPIDGSQSSLVALRHLIDTVDATTVEVHMVNVQRLSMHGDFARNVAVQLEARARLAAAEQLLERPRMILTAKSIPFRTSLLFGDPARALVRYATEHGVDAIVMGTRSRKTVSRLPGGSVAMKVASLTDVPVTLVKAATTRLTEPTGGTKRC